MNECYHNSWLAGWMYEGDMNERRSWDRAPQLGQTPRAVETLFFSHPLFCTRSMLTAHSADDIHALCQSHDYAVLLRSQPVGRVVEDYFLCKTRVSQCVCRISYTCLAVRADYFHDGISPERYSACLHWCRSALGGHIADMSSSEGGGLGVTGGGPDGGGGETFPHMIASCKSSKLSSRADQASGAELRFHFSNANPAIQHFIRKAIGNSFRIDITWNEHNDCALPYRLLR